jgi:Secretion system C-terminal sorting domain
MKLITYCVVLICIIMTAGLNLQAQVCIESAKDGFNCSNDLSLGGCPTFDTCFYWIRSHGTPESETLVAGQGFIEMVGNSSGSEGIYHTYDFIAGQNYDIYMAANFYGSTGGVANGSFTIYAASGVLPQSTNTCQQTPQNISNKYAMFSIANENYSPSGLIKTVSPIPQSYQQIWIYPTEGTSSVNLDFYGFGFCPSCYAVATYSSSTFSPLPTQINGQDITISEPAQSVPTAVTATQAIYLQTGFNASSSNGASFTATIQPCTTNMDDIIRKGLDSTKLADLASINTASNTGDSAATMGFRIFPTVGRGTVTLAGSAASLVNAHIIVLSEIGQTMYQQYNVAATTLQLDLTSLPNGLYFIQIRQQNKVTTQKIIINH